MANKEIILQNVARDLTTGQFFALKFIDGGAIYTMYLEELTQPPRQPALASQISATGVPVIAPSGAGDVIGIGTTGRIPLWTDGPNSVIGNSGLSYNLGTDTVNGSHFIFADNCEVQGLLTVGDGLSLTDNLTLVNGVISFPDNIRQTFNPGAANPGLNVGSIAGDPSTPINGDLWYDSTGNLLRAQVNGTTRSIGATTPGGIDTDVQFNDSGAFGGDAQFTFNKTSGLVTLTAAASDGSPLASFLPGAGASFTRINNNGTIVIDSDVATGSFPLLIKNNGVTLWAFGFAANLAGSATSAIQTSIYQFIGADAALSRITSGVVGIGTGAAGSVAGSIQAQNFIAPTAGAGFQVKEGSNATMGTGTLNGTTEVTISTTKVTANSRIFLSIQTPGGTPSGTIYVSSRSAGTSFGVKSTALDTSTFAWWIVEPAA
jgi:hypothetical protein